MHRRGVPPGMNEGKVEERQRTAFDEVLPGPLLLLSLCPRRTDAGRGLGKGNRHMSISDAGPRVTP
jgi:hypothetical protein